jgi:hypothetical protein
VEVLLQGPSGHVAGGGVGTSRQSINGCQTRGPGKVTSDLPAFILRISCFLVTKYVLISAVFHV